MKYLENQLYNKMTFGEIFIATVEVWVFFNNDKLLLKSMQIKLSTQLLGY